MIDAKLADYANQAQSAPTPAEREQFAAAARDLQDYKNLAATYREFKPYQEAVAAAQPNRGAFTFRALARKARPGSNVESLGQDATEVLEGRPASRPGFRTLGGLGLDAGLALYGHPLAAGAALALPNALALRSAQRGLYGDTVLQKALAAAVRRNPQAAYSLGLAGRSAVNAEQQ